MNKINNILKNIYLNDCSNSNIIKSNKVSETTNANIIPSNDLIQNNSLIISKLNDQSNSYLLYYKDDIATYLLSYIIQEGNGLYKNNKTNSLSFNIDNNSIQESYNKIFINTNSINISNDNSYNYGISYIDYSYLINYNNTITVNNDFISYFINIKNKINDLCKKYEDMYNQISYYNEVIKKSNNISNYTIIYDYKDIEVSFIDNYYYFNHILNNKIDNNSYITLSPNSNIIYYKDISSLNIKLSLISDYMYQLNNNGLTNKDNYIYSFSDLEPVLYNDNKYTYFTNLIPIKNNYKIIKLNEENEYSPYLSYTLNSVFFGTNEKTKYGSNINIKINNDTSSYTNIKYLFSYDINKINNNDIDNIINKINNDINNNINVTINNINDEIINHNNIDENKTKLIKNELNDQYYLNNGYLQHKTITKYVPSINELKFVYDDRDISYGTSCFIPELKNSYVFLLYSTIVNKDNFRSILENNPSFIKKMIENNVIWYNNDSYLYYGYNISHINGDLYIKEYTPLFKNISTKVLNYDFLLKYQYSDNFLDDIPNLDTIDIDLITSELGSYVYSKSDKDYSYVYIYAFKYDDNNKFVKEPNSNNIWVDGKALKI